MGYHIISEGQKVGWTDSVYPTDSTISFVDDSTPWVDDINALKHQQKEIIKQQAIEKLEATEWRLMRAQERDKIAVTGETVNDVLVEREAIRRASSRAELELEQLDDAELILNFVWEVGEDDAPNVRTLTKLQFLRRFTQAERTTLIQARQSNEIINDYMEMLELATLVNLEDPDIIGGVHALEQVGIVGNGRAAQILAES